MRPVAPVLAAGLVAAVGTAAQAQTAQAQPTQPAQPVAAAVVKTVDQICMPLLDGAELKSVAKSTGLDEDDGEWRLEVDGDRGVVVDPPSGSNKTVCQATITYAVDNGAPIVAALDGWASAHTLTKDKDRQPSEGPLRMRKTTSWFGPVGSGALAVVLSEEKQLDGKPVEGDLDQATLLVSKS